MEQYVKVKGITGSVFMAAGATGEIVGPIIIGTLFDRFGPSCHSCMLCVLQYLHLW